MKRTKLLLLTLLGLLLAGAALLLLRGGVSPAAGAVDARGATGPRSVGASARRPPPAGVRRDARRAVPAGDATLTGRAFEAFDGIAVAGAQVVIERSSRSSPPLELLTDDGGAFEVRLPAGHYMVSLEPGEPLGSSTMEVRLAPGANEPVVFALEAAFTRAVLVRSWTPGRGSNLPEPVPRARLRLVPWENSSGPGEAGARTAPDPQPADDQGVGTLRDVPSGDHALLVTATGYADQRLRVSFSYAAFLADRRAQSRPLVVPMIRRGQDLIGTVLDDRGQPIAGALVAYVARVEGGSRSLARRARERGEEFVPGSPPSCRTDEDGNFQLATLKGVASPAVVVVPRSERAPTVFGRVLREPDGAPLVVQAPLSCAVELRFEQDGSPVNGHVSVSDGRWRYDWSADPMLRRLGAGGADEFETVEGLVRFRLPLGGFKVLFSPADAAAPESAFFQQVDALAPLSATLSIP